MVQGAEKSGLQNLPPGRPAVSRPGHPPGFRNPRDAKMRNCPCAVRAQGGIPNEKSGGALAPRPFASTGRAAVSRCSATLLVNRLDSRFKVLKSRGKAAGTSGCFPIGSFCLGSETRRGAKCGITHGAACEQAFPRCRPTNPNRFREHRGGSSFAPSHGKWPLPWGTPRPASACGRGLSAPPFSKRAARGVSHAPVMVQSVPACPRSGRTRPEQADTHHGHVVAAAGGGPFLRHAQQFLAQPVRRVRQPFFQRVLQNAFAGLHRAV